MRHYGRYTNLITALLVCDVVLLLWAWGGGFLDWIASRVHFEGARWWIGSESMEWIWLKIGLVAIPVGILLLFIGLTARIVANTPDSHD